MTSVRAEEQSQPNPRMWRTADAVHIDLRGASEPIAALMQAIDSGGIDSALVGHFECEPIFLYPELDERGWSHEILESHCGGGPDCEDGLMLRMERWGR